MGHCQSYRNKNYLRKNKRRNSDLSLTAAERRNLSYAHKSGTVFTYDCCYRALNDQKMLKQALDHPTVCRYLHCYVEETHGCAILRSYLLLYGACVDVRRLVEQRDIQEAEHLLENFTSSFPAGTHLEDSKLETAMLAITSKSETFLSKVEVLRLMQYRLFYKIQEDLWIPFCSSKSYDLMISAKSVRLLITLAKFEQTHEFAAIVPK